MSLQQRGPQSADPRWVMVGASLTQGWPAWVQGHGPEAEGSIYASWASSKAGHDWNLETRKDIGECAEGLVPGIQPPSRLGSLPPPLQPET